MSKVQVYESEEFDVYMQQHEGSWFIHVSAYDFNKSILTEMAEALAEIKLAFNNAGVEHFYACSPNHKFCELFGGVLIKMHYNDNVEYGVYRWETT